MDHLRAMRVFVRVAERGNFGAAAADLGLSHGMASAIVKEIEAQLGTELIRRTTRRMALTAEGELYLDRARAITAEVDALHERLGGGGRTVQGQLVLQAPSAFSRLLLAPALGGFLERHPHLDLTVLTRDGLPDMVAEGIDMLVYVGPLPDSGLMARGLGRFPIVTAASPDYIARQGRPDHPGDLARHRCINIRSSTSGRPLEWFHRIDGATALNPVAASLSVESSEAAVAAAEHGAGVVQNISYALAESLASGRLVELLAPYRDAGPEMHIVTRRQMTVPARMRAVASLIEDIVRRRRARDGKWLIPQAPTVS